MELGGTGMDDPCLAPGALRPIHCMLYMWHALDDMFWMARRSVMSVPGNFDSHGGDDVVWTMAESG